MLKPSDSELFTYRCNYAVGKIYLQQEAPPKRHQHYTRLQ